MSSTLLRGRHAARAGSSCCARLLVALAFTPACAVSSVELAFDSGALPLAVGHPYGAAARAGNRLLRLSSNVLRTVLCRWRATPLKPGCPPPYGPGARGAAPHLVPNKPGPRCVPGLFVVPRWLPPLAAARPWALPPATAVHRPPGPLVLACVRCPLKRLPQPREAHRSPTGAALVGVLTTLSVCKPSDSVPRKSSRNGTRISLLGRI